MGVRHIILKCIDDEDQFEVNVLLSKDLNYYPKFTEVIEIINHYAFIKSEFPLIITIEN